MKVNLKKLAITHKYITFPFFTGILKQVIAKDFCPEAYNSLNNIMAIFKTVKYIPGV